MISLFGFQSQASAQIAERFSRYVQDPPLRGTEKKRRKVPFYQALEAITGAGKTAMLADAVERMRPILPIQPFVMWLSKGRVIVAQTYANLQDGGKYHHLIGSFNVHLLSEYRTEYALDASNAYLFFATVGTFNQKDKEHGERLIFRSEIDTADVSTWEALKNREDRHGRRRPLIIVYDEAQNLSDQQTTLLFELEPDAFIVASATMRIPATLARVLIDLKETGWDDASLITTVHADKIAASGLIKTEISLGGYQSPMGATVDEMLGDMRRADEAVARQGLSFHPKAIYVAKTNIIEGDSHRRDDPKRPFLQREAPPIIIWRYLVHERGVHPSEIAVYCTLDFDKNYPPPSDFVLFKGGDSDYDEFTKGNFRHIIFNLSLQEGWDDPACYFAYIDKSMGSDVQVEQLVGRVLRQPAATHYDAEILNTAHFYVRVDAKSVFAAVVNAVRLRIQRDAPTIKVSSYGLGSGSKQVEYMPSEEKTVPKVYADSSLVLEPVAHLIEALPDFQDDTGINTRGEGSRAIIQQRIGEKNDAELKWVSIEHNNPVSARWVFQRAVMRLYPKALEVAGSDDTKFDVKIEVGSKAYGVMERLADDVVSAYFQYVRLRERPHNAYTVMSIFADPARIIKYQNALHSGYTGLNPLEREFATALDDTGLTWCRNPSKTGFGIPLLSVGRTGQFFPDFLVWQGNDVFGLDTTGEHLLHEKTGRKLLAILPDSRTMSQLYIRLISRGRWNGKVEQTSKDGFTVWRLREDRELGMDYVETVTEAVQACLRTEQTVV